MYEKEENIFMPRCMANKCPGANFDRRSSGKTHKDRISLVSSGVRFAPHIFLSRPLLNLQMHDIVIQTGRRRLVNFGYWLRQRKG